VAPHWHRCSACRRPSSPPWVSWRCSPPRNKYVPHRDVAQPVPLHLRNAPTKLMKDLEYGKGYRYAHNEEDAVADMSCLPPALEGRKYYEPKERGFEKEIKRRLDGWEQIKRKGRK
jgi:replication-associated recombination protein RarA